MSDRTAETLFRPHRPIPRFIGKSHGGAQGFRVAHRMRLRKALMAIDEARLGCVHSGDMHALQKAYALVEQAIEHCRPHNWEKRKR